MEAEKSRLEVDATARELERLRARLAHAIRLASAFRTLDEATSLGDILEHLAQSACQETGRTGRIPRQWREAARLARAGIRGAVIRSSDPISSPLREALWDKPSDWESASSTEMVMPHAYRHSPRLTALGTHLRCPFKSVDRLLPCCMPMRRGPIVRKTPNGWT